MNNQLTVLPKEQKQTVAKTMFDLNVSAKNIADILGIHRATVYRYSDKPTKPELRQFATELRTLMAVKQQTVLAKIVKRLEEIIDNKSEMDGWNLKSLVNAFMVLRRTTPDLVDIQREERSNTLTDSLNI